MRTREHEELVVPGEPSIAVRVHSGDGPAVVLLHGLACNLENWRLVIDALPHDWHVVSVDLRSHGWSAPGPWSFANAASDLRRVISHLGIGEHVLAGHSLGGMVASICSVTPHPGLRAAVNLDGHAWLGDHRYWSSRPADRSRLIEHAHQAARRALPSEDEDGTAVLAQLVEQLRAQPDASSAAALAMVRRSTHVEGSSQRMRPSHDEIAAILEAVNALDMSGVYTQLQIPVHLVRAEMTSSSPPPELAEYEAYWAEELSRLSATHDQLTLESIDATHGLLVEAPVTTAAIIERVVHRHLDAIGAL